MLLAKIDQGSPNQNMNWTRAWTGHWSLSRPVLTIHKIESFPKSGIFHFKDALQNTPYIMELVSGHGGPDSPGIPGDRFELNVFRRTKVLKRKPKIATTIFLVTFSVCLELLTTKNFNFLANFTKKSESQFSNKNLPIIKCIF